MPKKQFNISDAWKVYNGYVTSMFGNIAVCRHCEQTMISDEAATHLNKYHPKEAGELLWLILQRMEWENEQLTV